jgi:hypothetical protein
MREVEKTAERGIPTADINKPTQAKKHEPVTNEPVTQRQKSKPQNHILNESTPRSSRQKSSRN